MAIVVKSKKIKEDIIDENGKILGTISYNPEDTKTYTKLTEIMKDLYAMNDEIKKVQNLKQLTSENLNKENIEKYRDDINEMNEALNLCDEKIENIKQAIDDIFGQGTSKLIMEDSGDIDMLMPLLEEVMPKFKKARKDKTSKYLDQKVEQLDVME